jgi:adenosylmethionine-8-amino-7-oxononanoate aminotransferase
VYIDEPSRNGSATRSVAITAPIAAYDEECEALIRGFLSPAFFEAGLICRADDRGDPVVQISPPLVATESEMDEIVGILGDVLAEASRRVRR